MGYPKLTYDDYIENLDYWQGQGVEAPKWADVLYDRGCDPVSAIDFYDDIFGDDLEPHRLPEDYRTGEYGAIAVEIEKKGKTERAHRITVTEGNFELYDLIERSNNFCMVAPISYAGKNRSNENARFMYALCIEIDAIEPKHGIDEIFYIFRRPVRAVAHPTYIVCSGTGLHLYWVFERPIPLYKNVLHKLAEIKKYMTYQLWDKQTSTAWQHIQYESVCQPFRLVGTVGKKKSRIAMAFKVGHKLTIEDLNKPLPDNLNYKSTLPLEKAKELYPDWYQRRIIEKQGKGHYTRHEGIYHNWIDKILQSAEVGHRYNCLENLCSLAVQCEIAPEQVEKDVRRVAEHLETLTVKEDNHFTEYDITCALRTYYRPTDGTYHRKIEYIAQKTAIPLTPNRRNGRKQAEHLKIARFTRDLSNENWREGNGRPDKAQAVREWRESHPEGKKADCIRDTGLSKPTVYKWWDN